MIPVSFPGANVTIAKDQPPYIPLPAHFCRDKSGTAIICWQLTEEELQVLITTRRIWMSCLTFCEPFQPMCPSVERPQFEEAPVPVDMLPVVCDHGIPLGLACDQCSQGPE